MAVMTIPLTKGKVALVDAEDYARIGHLKWCADRGYAVRGVRRPDGTWTKEYMHRAILGYPTGEVDHADGDGCNNVRANIRHATRSENNQNQRRPSTNTSGLKGASWDKAARRWQAKITVERRQIHLGRFATREAAHAAYIEASARLHRSFGRIA